MKSGVFAFLILVFPSIHVPSTGQAKENKPLGWAYVSSRPVDVRAVPSGRKHAFGRLDRGALTELYESVDKGAAGWSRVRVLNLETLATRTGWVDSSEIERFPLDRFPSNSDLMKQLGGAYLEDFVSSHIEIARFLVRQAGEEPVMVCLLGSSVLPQTRLQVFRPTRGKFAPDVFLESPFSGLKPQITAMEVRDLLGDGNECLVTHESFDSGLENRGLSLVIRRIRSRRLEKLWEAPLEYRNLASFPARLEILTPAEKNIGLPGTVTTGNVEFLPRGARSQPSWKGRVEFHVVGREEPVESVAIEKVCPWNGTKFAPL